GLALQESLLENQALIISAPDPSDPTATPIQYWIRCLPHDFPQLTATQRSSPPPGWYLTGNFSTAVSGTYAMVLDTNGTPVWYRKPAGPSAVNVTLLADGSIAWMSNPGPGFGVDPDGAYEVYDPRTQTTS